MTVESGSFLIAIDGPSGSGKSTTAKLLARRVGVGYLDTGAMYRAATAEVMRSLPKDADDEAIISLVDGAAFKLSTDPDDPRFSINGIDVTAEIREPRISAHVSRVATILPVRRILTQKMREIIADHGRRIVAEGRDITTVVAPDADVRVLLVADPQARVARRAAEVAGKATAAEVTDQVLRRDRDDSTVSNFTDAADGVVVIDSTFLTPDEVVDQILQLAATAAGWK